MKNEPVSVADLVVRFKARMSIREEYLLDSLRSVVWIKLPIRVMSDCGPAVQTLGGILSVSSKKTFINQTEISRRAGLPLGTLRRHLKTLADRGWIIHHGRQRTPRGFLRRTATLTVTEKTREACKFYGVLPRWAVQEPRLPWCARAVLSVWMANLMKVESARMKMRSLGTLKDFIDEAGTDRFHFPLTFLERETGLARHSVIKAKHYLAEAGIVLLSTNGSDSDSMLPNSDHRVTWFVKSKTDW